METCSELNHCHPQNCRRACAREVVDALLREHGSVRGEEVDLLLDLRWLVGHREQPEATLRLFCELRRRLEDGHYVLFYRLRRWLENNLEVRIAAGDGEVTDALKLDFYCLEAIRAAALRQARANRVLPAGAKVLFGYRSVEVVAMTGAGAPGRT